MVAMSTITRVLHWLLLPVAAPVIWLGCRWSHSMNENAPAQGFSCALRDWLGLS